MPLWVTAVRLNHQALSFTACLLLVLDVSNSTPSHCLPGAELVPFKSITDCVLGALPTPHLPIPVARVTGDTVVQAPVGQRLLFIEDKLLQLHLHFCAGHSTWRGRKHKAVTGGSDLKWDKGELVALNTDQGDRDIAIVIQEAANTMEAS